MDTPLADSAMGDDDPEVYRLLAESLVGAYLQALHVPTLIDALGWEDDPVDDALIRAVVEAIQPPSVRRAGGQSDA